MADLTWYSREGADSRFLTKSEATSLATAQSVSQSAATLRQEISQVRSTSDAALPRTEAASTYATKEALAQAQLGGGGQAPDLSSYATKAEVQSADSALSNRIDSLDTATKVAAAKADAAATPASVQSAIGAATSNLADTYATKAALADYLQRTEAAGTYATKSDLANAQLGGKGEAPDLSHLATRAEMGSADSALGSRIDEVSKVASAAATKASLSGYLTTTAAAQTYATKADIPAKPDLSPYLTKADASTTYATSEALSQAVSAADGKYTTPETVAETYATKAALAAATEAAKSAYAPASLAGEVAAVKATAEAALPKSEAAVTYATKEELTRAQLSGKDSAPDLSGFVKSAQLADYLRKEDASKTYAAKSEVAAVKAVADAALPKTAATSFATSEGLDAVRRTASAALTKSAADAAYAPASLSSTVSSLASSLEGYAKSEDVSETYATKSEVSQVRQSVTDAAKSAAAAQEAAQAALTQDTADRRYATPASVAAVKTVADAALPKTLAASTYATKSELSSSIAAIPTPDLSGYAKKTDIPSLAGYATTSSLNAVKATADAALPAATASSTYATKAELTAGLAKVPAAPDLSGYAKKTDLPNLSGYATTSSVTAVKATADAALPKTEAASTYATKSALGGYAKLEALATLASKSDLEPLAKTAALEALQSQLEALISDQKPFKAGQRYSSPVTYYWPDYYNESKGTSKWAKALKAGNTLGLVILNKDSGNWDEKNNDFGTQASRALSAGAKRAVFYVKTQYGVASLPSNDPARNGVPNPDKFTKEYILGQIAKFTEQYGDVAQGVFLDETINGWGAQASRVAWYKDLIDSIRNKYGNGFYIVVNAGSNMSPEMCALNFDTAMMFEQDAKKWLTEDPSAPILPDHMAAYPSERWWAVVHGVTQDNYKAVFEKADKLAIGHLYITDGVLVEDPNRGGQWEPVGNPYENPPSDQLIRLTSAWIHGTLPLQLKVEEMEAAIEALKKQGGNGGGSGVSNLIVLGKNDPVPAGTPANTVIVRKEK